MAALEQRRLVDYYLAGPRRPRHFFSGLAVGFAALSLLMGGLAAGGWLHLNQPTLSAAADLRYALLWGCVFLMVACVEEGSFRCYLQFTLTRGVNFWWALGLVGFVCIDLMVKTRWGLDLLAVLSFQTFRTAGGGALGVYAIALLGLGPCLLLYLKRTPGRAFWQAAWVTSTLFGFLHTGNGGENWIGIFSAAGIGFVFCVSVRVTGSAWWAIGCHAGWDWAETYFYGTADSGLTAPGHLLSTTPAGNPLWSGGADGPEGSLLILGILVLFLVWLVAVHGRGSTVSSAEESA
jgi:membrane protease YdiL (CAAX protease family)